MGRLGFLYGSSARLHAAVWEPSRQLSVPQAEKGVRTGEMRQQIRYFHRLGGGRQTPVPVTPYLEF